MQNTYCCYNCYKLKNNSSVQENNKHTKILLIYKRLLKILLTCPHGKKELRECGNPKCFTLFTKGNPKTKMTIKEA